LERRAEVLGRMKEWGGDGGYRHRRQEGGEIGEGHVNDWK